MRRHNQRLYRAARAILRDEAEVENVLQEAYARAFTHLDQFQGLARFSTWLSASRCTRPFIAASRGAALRISTTAWMSCSSRCGTGRAGIPGRAAAASRGLDRPKPEAFRAVFVLRDVKGLSTADTAACLTIPEETVKTRLHRARQQLRRQLDPVLGTALKDAFASASNAATAW